MVSANPVKRLYRYWEASVINDVIVDVAFFTLIAMMVAMINEWTDRNVFISNQMLTVLGTVLGLVISFRTSTAYERWSEGRKLWTNIGIASRNLAQVIWIHVPDERYSDAAKKTLRDIPKLQVVIEKKSMVNLVQAFAVSVKHMLRGEAGVYYADLYPLISFLPRFSTTYEKATVEDMLPLWDASEMDHEMHGTIRQETMSRFNTPAPSRANTLPLALNGEESFGSDEKELRETQSWTKDTTKGRSHKKRRVFSPESVLPTLPSERTLRPARCPPQSSILQFFKDMVKAVLLLRKHNDELPTSAHSRSFTGKKIKPTAADSNVPLEITLFLSTYFSSLMKQGLLTPASATTMVNAIGSLQDSLNNLERIKKTPLPFAYQAHLRMSLWLYLFFLPFQIYSAFKWLTIPATAFASFLLLGFLEIGREIEDPFNYDLNDHDLDAFCHQIARELHEITAHTTPEPESFLFTEFNQPFAPADRRSAREMLDDNNHAYHGVEDGIHHIRQTLLRSWRDVDEKTRK